MYSPVLVSQSQPCQESCVSTCLAMVLGLSAEHVRNRWNDKYHKESLSLSSIFEELGLKWEAVDPLTREGPTVPGIYFLSVPSLNYQAGMHQILGEVFKDEEGKILWNLADPQYENKPYLYYSAGKIEEDERSVAIKGYTIDCFIPIDEVLRWRKENL